jgi:hypothetical protein
MELVKTLLERIRSSGEQVWTGSPQSEQRIQSVESQLGLRFPPSYRDFVATFGGLSIGDSVVSGIADDDPLADSYGNAFADTNRFRSEYRLPESLLVVQPDEDAPYCIDAQRPDEHGEGDVICYENHSGNVTKISDSFGTWLVAWLSERVEQCRRVS